MKFKGPANTKYNINKPKYGEPSAIRFDDNGIIETHNKFLARRLAQHFEKVPDGPEQPKQEQTAGMPCKKCGFVAQTQTELMLHYRTEHPKKPKEQ